MFMTGAYLISKYANKPYTEFATERLFKPMNMSTTTFWPGEGRERGLLTQTWTKFGRRVPFGFPDEVVELVAGPGGIISSAADLVRSRVPSSRGLTDECTADEVADRPPEQRRGPYDEQDHHPEFGI